MKRLTSEEIEQVDGGMIYEFFFAVGHLFGDANQVTAKAVESGSIPMMYMN